MFSIYDIGNKFPSVIKPLQKLTLNEKMKWTFAMLILYFVLGSIVIWGVDHSAVAHFEFLEIVFGSKMGSLITLGIGPIVTASIILQLLVGSKILNWDIQNNPSDKAKFTSTQKMLAISFCIIEAIAYVLAGAVPPAGGEPMLAAIVILQLIAGGILIIFMDEVVSKWGIGSGISLFIAAGVSKTIFLRTFSPPLKDASGGIISNVVAALSGGAASQAFLFLLPLIATIVVLIIVVFAQGVKIEIPMAFALPFGKFASRKWPLKFIYTSNIPVILTAAVLANMQVVGRLLSSRGISLLGEFDASTGSPVSGLIMFVTRPSSPSLILITVIGGVVALLFTLIAIKTIQKHVLKITFLGAIVGIILAYFLIMFYPALPALQSMDVIRAITYTCLMVLGSVIFSKFWVMTSGMDAHSVAEQFKSASIMIPGFRRDPRIVERVLNRYIPSLTILGGAFVGFLAAFADLTGALGTGTGILLTVMIVYQFYEQIMSQHYDELPEIIKKFVSG